MTVSLPGALFWFYWEFFAPKNTFCPGEYLTGLKITRVISRYVLMIHVNFYGHWSSLVWVIQWRRLGLNFGFQRRAESWYKPTWSSWSVRSVYGLVEGCRTNKGVVPSSNPAIVFFFFFFFVLFFAFFCFLRELENSLQPNSCISWSPYTLNALSQAFTLLLWPWSQKQAPKRMHLAWIYAKSKFVSFEQHLHENWLHILNQHGILHKRHFFKIFFLRRTKSATSQSPSICKSFEAEWFRRATYFWWPNLKSAQKMVSYTYVGTRQTPSVSSHHTHTRKDSWVYSLARSGLSL